MVIYRMVYRCRRQNSHDQTLSTPATHIMPSSRGRGASILCVLLLARVVSSTPTVIIKNGTYSGLSVPSFTQEHFLGMPYAQPPVPPMLRFHSPLSLNTSWAGTREANKYSPICVGYPSGTSNDDIGYELSEDCLTANVIRPTGVKKGDNVPVVVWL
jgi:acetylcholinesterase